MIELGEPMTDLQLETELVELRRLLVEVESRVAEVEKELGIRKMKLATGEPVADATCRVTYTQGGVLE